MATATAIKGRKGGSSESRTPTEQPDDLQSVAKAKILLALGEGEFYGGLTAKQIFLDGTAIENADGSQNFSGVAWEFRSGTQAQSYIQGIPGTENEIAVGTDVTITTAWIHTFTNTQLSAIRLRLKWPALFKQEDDGDLVGYSINYAIDLQTDGGSWVTVLSTAVTGKTTTGYERSHRIDLPQAGSTWTVRVRKLTAEANSAKIGDTMTLQSYTEVIDAKLRYPNTALLYIEFDSSQFNGSIPQITCEPKGRVIRVPDNYDPATRSYTGTWLGTFKWAWTDNPAWIFYDIVVSDRFGLGDRLTVANIDKWTLYQVAQYCDQMVPDGKGGSGTEPRYKCDVYVQTRNDAYTVMRDFAAIFRGMTYWGGDQIVALADMPRDVDYNFTNANVVDGEFAYSSSTTKTRYTSALVSYSDPDNGYADAMEPVFEKDLVSRYKTFNQLEVTAIGCTRQSEANRKGRWGILTNNKDRVVVFSVGLDGDIPMPGYIIAIADEYLSGRVAGGRISSVNARAITLDRAPDAKVGDRLQVNLPSGISQARTIQSLNGNIATVTTAYSETPEAECVWVVESSELYAQQYRVTTVTENDDGTYAITGTAHDPDKYPRIDTGAVIDQRPISVIPPGNQAAPTNVVIDSYSVVNQGISLETMRVHWDDMQNAIAYEAQWRRNDGNWISVARSSTTSFEVPSIYAGRYLARVRAINAAEISSGWGYSQEITLTGKVGNPPKPVGFTASEDVVFGVELNWGFPANTSDTLKTEIQYSLTADGASPMLLADVAYPTALYQQMGLKAGQIFWYRAQLVDKTGNESGFTDWVRGQASTDASDILDWIGDDILNTDAGKQLVSRVDSVEEQVGELNNAVTAAQGDIADFREELDKNSGDVATVSAAITAEQQARVEGDNALGQLITDVKATTDNNTSRLTTVEKAVTDNQSANVQRLDSLDASTASNAANITSEQNARADADTALGQRVDAVKATTDGNAASIGTLQTAQSDTNQAIANLTQSTQAAYSNITNQALTDIENALGNDAADQARREDVGEVKGRVTKAEARITTTEQTQADATQAFAQYQQTVEAQFNATGQAIDQTNVVVQQTSSALATLDGKASAQYSVKLGIDQNGRYYAAGMGIGLENTPGGMQSQVLFLADRFAVMTQVGATPRTFFAIQNGQTIIDSAFIGDGTITNAMIGAFIQSTNYVAGSAGWRLDKTGTFERNAANGSGRVVDTGTLRQVYDSNGTLRIKDGLW
ncbi:phage tail protein [Pantoea rwandensis]|uniref:Host specificity protein n=1 Tax=Pantoea rwandensis TaxID=1076550 RepID=A0A1X1CNX2_9GAMM|nr:phage tail protein [Pantoea rwandensis]ORM66133.1 host specificity protein [Pantoea rwandensis]